MNFMEFVSRFFGKETVNSKDMAKDRLRLVLVHDRINMSPQVLEALKEDLIKVINKYMEIDQQTLEVSLSAEDGTMALVANIPVRNIRRQVS